MLETYVAQAIAAMVTVKQQAPNTEMAGLAFAIATLLDEFLNNLEEMREADADATDDTDTTEEVN